MVEENRTPLMEAKPGDDSGTLVGAGGNIPIGYGVKAICPGAGYAGISFGGVVEVLSMISVGEAHALITTLKQKTNSKCLMR
jgi:hypothetical protein